MAVPRPPDWKQKLVSVGVTGTNGKTSTTRFCATMLGTIAKPVASTTTVGSFFDDEPFEAAKTFAGFLHLLETAVQRGSRFAALEMTSEALSKGFAKAWPCEIAAFTNLTHDHLEAHGSPEHYLASKAQLFMALPEDGTAVLNGCDAPSELLSEVVPAHAKILRYGVLGARSAPTSPLDATGTNVALSWDGTSFDVALTGALAHLAADAPKRLSLRAIGTVFAENALSAWLAAIAAGASPTLAAEALATAPPPPGRFEVVSHAPYVVVDYAHTPDAIARTVRAARTLCKGRLTIAFGAGGNRDKKKRAPMGAAASSADRVILTSDNPRDESARVIASQIRDGIGKKSEVVVELDRRRAIELALEGAGPDDVIVVAGRGHETEQVIGTEKTRFSDVEVVRELTVSK